MDFIYVLIIVAAFFVEVSQKINTDNISKKLGIGLVIVGAIIHLNGQENSLPEIGILFIFSKDIFCAYFSRKNRRVSDRALHK